MGIATELGWIGHTSLSVFIVTEQVVYLLVHFRAFIPCVMDHVDILEPFWVSCPFLFRTFTYLQSVCFTVRIVRIK